MKNKLLKPTCSICKQSVSGNVNPEKILTCGLCVISLMGMEKDLKIYYRDKLIKAGHVEAARSIESFIVEEEVNGELRPTIKRERIGKVTRNVNRRIIRVSKTRLPVGEDREKSLLL